MQAANFLSKILEIECTDGWMPVKGLTYGTTIKFGGAKSELFTMLFSRTSATKVSGKVMRQKVEIMLLAPSATSGELPINWNPKNITITTLFPVPVIPEVHGKVIKSSEPNFKFDKDKEIPVDCR